MSYKITVLVEDTAPPGLEAEHGLSLFVETPGSTFLFDHGQTGMAWRNAARLGVDISSAEFVVISHSHYDHARGFPELLEHTRPSVVYTGPDFWKEKSSYDSGSEKYVYKGCGFDSSDLKEWGVEQRVCQDLLELDADAWLFTGAGKRYPFETVPEKFRRGASKEQDPFDDEIFLLLKEGDGLALVVGCSHQGILNIAAGAQERTGLPVRRIIGGIHLDGEGRERVEMTLKELDRLGIRQLDLCHCSGDIAPRRISTGSVIEAT